MGDHAENSFSVDGQPITDQQSKVFSNRFPSIPSSRWSSSQVRHLRIRRETSVVITSQPLGEGVTTLRARSPLPMAVLARPISGSTSPMEARIMGKLVSASGLNTVAFSTRQSLLYSRPGQSRETYRPCGFSALQSRLHHVNLGYTRSWFQNPNSFDTFSTRARPTRREPLGPPTKSTDQDF